MIFFGVISLEDASGIKSTAQLEPHHKYMIILKQRETDQKLKLQTFG